MADIDVRGALQTELQKVCSLDPAWEGVRYTPIPGTPYMEVTMIKSSELPYTIKGRVWQKGQMAVSLVYPMGQGTKIAEQQSQAIKDFFPLAKKITLNDTTVQIMFAQSNKIMEDADWFRLPIFIGYQAFGPVPN